MKTLEVGTNIWVKIPKVGFVGYGKVVETAKPIEDFYININEAPTKFIDYIERSGAIHQYNRTSSDDQKEYFVRVVWEIVKEPSNAFGKTGYFGIQNTVCKPKSKKWEQTVIELKIAWGIA